MSPADGENASTAPGTSVSGCSTCAGFSDSRFAEWSGVSDGLRVLASIFTRSATEPADIFRITLPRCDFTVITLMLSSAAICLFSSPATTKAMTSRSRGVSDENALWSVRSSASLRSRAWL
jgi:hypothetical protein